MYLKNRRFLTESGQASMSQNLHASSVMVLLTDCTLSLGNCRCQYKYYIFVILLQYIVAATTCFGVVLMEIRKTLVFNPFHILDSVKNVLAACSLLTTCIF